MGSIPIGSAIDGTRPAGIGRRAGAFVYDALLLAALWMATTLVIVVARGGTAIPPGNLPYQALLLAITGAFFVGFWVRGGQTLGMRAWRLRVQRPDGRPLDPALALRRLAAGCIALLPLGAGLWWGWLDRDGLAWHDRVTGTRVVLLPRDDGRD